MRCYTPGHPKGVRGMSARLATRLSLAAALVAGLAFRLASTAPVHADEDPGGRAPPVRTYPPRVRTAGRTRVVYVPQPVYARCGSCASAAPVAYRPASHA